MQFYFTMEVIKIEPWMLKDFSEIEIDQIKKEAAMQGWYLTTDFIRWANDDMPYLEKYIKEQLNDYNQPNS